MEFDSGFKGLSVSLCPVNATRALGIYVVWFSER